jgi:hypothetical protein
LQKIGVRLTTLFAAEHGWAGTANEDIPHEIEPRSGLQSTNYGETYHG